jgi:phenylacetate-coenzyme A ligase PaaK-like adenylate-forming protein
MNPVDQLHVAGLLMRSLRSQWWPAQRIRAYQEGALVRMMRHAATKVPFYQSLGLLPESITRAADLERFPIIGKRDIQRSPESFLARGLEPESLRASRTSGSSGQPTTTYFDRSAWLLTRYALKMRRIVATSGYCLAQRVVVVSEQTAERLASLRGAAPSGLGMFYHQKYLSIHTPAVEHLDVLEKYRPHIVYAFPSYLLDLIAYAERCRRPLPHIQTLYTSSEVLTRAARARIERAFRGRVYDVYGSTEFKEVAWQCKAGRYHLNFESVYIEAPAGQQRGRVLMTSLCNLAMPLMRFDIGDRAVLGTHCCDCGRHSLNMIEFEGREADMIVLPGGRRVSPYLLTMAIEAEESILQYRINQTAADVLRVDVIVRSPGDSSRWREGMCARLASIVGSGIALTLREVERLERDASGKRSVFVRTPGASY